MQSNRYTYQERFVITPNVKHPHIAKGNAIWQMDAHKDKAEVHIVLGVAGLHGDFMKDNETLTQWLKQLVEQGNSVHTGVNKRWLSTGSNKP